MFGYSSYIIDDTSRFVLLTSGYHGDFEIPNTPGLTPQFTDMGRSKFNSAALDETQVEQDAYAIVAYQKKIDDFNMQASVFTLYSSVLFRPDNVGDLIFNGVASRVDRDIFSNGITLDASYKLNDQHTLRGGFLITAQHATVGTATLVFPVDANGNQASDIPLRIVDNSGKYGYFYGFYLQDEWKPFEQLTINFGGRFDIVDAFAHENQLSPRINIVYEPFKGTVLHAGYARYFTPPPLENVEQGTISKFDGTTNESAIQKDSVTKSERAHYFDAGMTQQIAEGFNVGIDGFYKARTRSWTKGNLARRLFFRRSITSVARFTEANLRRTMTRVGSPRISMRATNGRAERTSVHHNSYLIPMNSPSSRRTGSFSIMISASPVPPVFPTRGTTGKRESMDSMVTGCAKVLPILKSSVPTRHSTFTSRAGSRSQKRLPLKSVSMSSTFSTKSMNCAAAAASASARHSSASAAVSTARSLTIFEVGRSLSRL